MRGVFEGFRRGRVPCPGQGEASKVRYRVTCSELNAYCRPTSSRYRDRVSHDEEVQLTIPQSTHSAVDPDALSIDDHGFVFSRDIHVDIPSQSSPIAGVHTQTEPLNIDWTDPMTQIDNALSVWCFRNSLFHGLLATGLCSLTDISAAPFLFRNQCRLSTLKADPLPSQPVRAAFEDGLITHLITTVDFEQHSRELKTIDRPRLLSLYGRYRAVPNSLTDDQNALIYASLCLARHTQITTQSAGEVGQQAGGLREDVTYYRLACEMLRSWRRSSIYSVCEYG